MYICTYVHVCNVQVKGFEQIIGLLPAIYFQTTTLSFMGGLASDVSSLSLTTSMANFLRYRGGTAVFFFYQPSGYLLCSMFPRFGVVNWYDISFTAVLFIDHQIVEKCPQVLLNIPKKPKSLLTLLIYVLSNTTETSRQNAQETPVIIICLN